MMGKLVVLVFIGICASLLLVLARPARADECRIFDDTARQFVEAGSNVFVASWASVPDAVAFVEKRTGKHYEHVRAVFFVPLSDRLIVGMDIGGCLADPIYIFKSALAPTSVESGKTAGGIGA